MIWQSTLNLKSHILDCFDSALPNLTMSNLCVPRRHSERSEESILAICGFRANCLPYANLNIIHLIRSWFIYFTHCFKSRVLDTSLRINATLSMTKFLPYHDKTKRVVILSLCKRRSIHFGDSLTLGESKKHFGLLRRLQCLAMTIRHRFAQFTRFATSHTTFKGIKMQT